MKKFSERWNLKNGGLLDSVGTASVIGLHLVSGIIVGSVIGYFLDEWLGTGPWLKLVFFMLGLVAGFRNMYQDTKRLLRSQEKKDAPEHKTED